MIFRNQNSNEEKPLLLRAVESVVAGPSDIRETVEECRAQALRQKGAAALPAQDIQIKVADLIINRYAKTCGRVGGFTSLASVVPGVGTIVTLVGANAADFVVTMKYQIEMVMALAHLFGRDIQDEEERTLCYTVAGIGVASQAGLLSFQRFTVQSLKEASKRMMKTRAKRWLIQLFKKLGLRFTERGLMKAIPFGIGAITSYTSNKKMTTYIGRRARDYFIDTAQEGQES